MKTTHEREQVLFYLSLGATSLALVVTFALIGAEAYVRWSVNQDFSFLGGNTLEVLVVGTFLLLFGLVYLHRSK